MARKTYDGEDLAALARVLQSGTLSWYNGRAGPELEARFRKRFGSRRAVAVHSAMAGLQLGLMAAGVGEGDEVIVDPIVPFAAYSALYLHARPVFANVERATHNLDPASLRARITPRTKAVVVTHLWGLSTSPSATSPTSTTRRTPSPSPAPSAARKQEGLVRANDPRTRSPLLGGGGGSGGWERARVRVIHHDNPHY